MNPASTLRVRRVTGMLAAFWALLAIGLSLFALLASGRGPVMPLNSSFMAGVAVIHSASDEALASGVERGDRVVAIDGVPLIRMMQEVPLVLRLGISNEYEIQKRDGIAR